MARTNKLGTSFLGLSLRDNEETAIKKYLKDKDQSAKQLMRYLVRKELREQKLLK